MTLINEQDVSQDVDGTRADYYRGICPKYVNWMDQPPYTCKGKWIRGVCNFGVGDLHRVQASPCLFANKFNFDVDKNAAVDHFIHVLNLTLNEVYNMKYRSMPMVVFKQKTQ